MISNAFRSALLATTTAAALCVPAFAQDSITTDLGVIDRSTVGEAFKAPGYS